MAASYNSNNMSACIDCSQCTSLAACETARQAEESHVIVARGVDVRIKKTTIRVTETAEHVLVQRGEAIYTERLD